MNSKYSAKHIIIILILHAVTLLSNVVVAGERKDNSEELFEVELLLNQTIPMRDGNNLSANIYKPKVENGKSVKTSTVIFMTPYINDGVDNRGWYLAQRGFTFVAVDVRGRGDYEGEFKPFIQEAKDGYDIVE